MSPHGTRPRYQAGCRCAPCREANAEHQRRYRARRPETPKHPWMPANGCLAAVCWCGGEVLQVRVEDVRRGVTYSCGQDYCRPTAS
jgi:hypothetical protein